MTWGQDTGNPLLPVFHFDVLLDTFHGEDTATEMHPVAFMALQGLPEVSDRYRLDIDRGQDDIKSMTNSYTVNDKF